MGSASLAQVIGEISLHDSNAAKARARASRHAIVDVVHLAADALSSSAKTLSPVPAQAKDSPAPLLEDLDKVLDEKRKDLLATVATRARQDAKQLMVACTGIKDVVFVIDDDGPAEAKDDEEVDAVCARVVKKFLKKKSIQRQDLRDFFGTMSENGIVDHYIQVFAKKVGWHRVQRRARLRDVVDEYDLSDTVIFSSNPSPLFYLDSSHKHVNTLFFSKNAGCIEAKAFHKLIRTADFEAALKPRDLAMLGLCRSMGRDP